MESLFRKLAVIGIIATFGGFIFAMWTSGEVGIRLALSGCCLFLGVATIRMVLK